MVPASLLLAVVIRMEQLEEELAELKRNSRNSSKPPSSDRHNPSKPSDKKPGRLQGKKGKKRKPGGQKGHAGKSLRQVAHPDYIVEHRIDRRAGRCQHCESSLRGAKPVGVEKRQVFDLPENLAVEVTEHRAEICSCRCCGRTVKAAFPEAVKAPAQYGERLKTMVLYLHTYQLLPCERLGEFFGDVFQCRLSPGTVSAFLKQGGARAGPVASAIKTNIAEAAFLHCDEWSGAT